MLFRPHRRFLDEAMAEVQEIATIEDIRKITGVTGKIEVSPYCYDERINWNTYIVTEDGKAFGFTNGPV